MCQIIEYTSLCRKPFSLCLSLYRIIKKLRQAASNRNPKAVGAGRLWCPWLVRRRDRTNGGHSRSFSVSGILLWLGEGEGGRGRVGGTGSSATLPRHPLLRVCQISDLWHLGWQTQLLSFQNWNRGERMLAPLHSQEKVLYNWGNLKALLVRLHMTELTLDFRTGMAEVECLLS